MSAISFQMRAHGLFKVSRILCLCKSTLYPTPAILPSPPAHYTPLAFSSPFSSSLRVYFTAISWPILSFFQTPSLHFIFASLDLCLTCP